MIVGLTGGSGCGTSLAGSVLESQGWAFIDCDRVYHRLLVSDRNLSAALAQAFGNEVLNAAGLIDRKALAKIVFQDKASLEKLNSITHPAILAEVTRQIAASEKKNVCIEAVELIESGINTLCAAVIGVLADYETRVYRIMIRDALLRSEAMRRIDSQRPDEYYLKACDYCIYNNDTIGAFKEKLFEVISSLENQQKG